jgi:hypothetical protein
MYVPRIRQLIRNSEGKYTIAREQPKGLCCVFKLKKEDGKIKCFFQAESMNGKLGTWVDSSKCEESEKFLLEEVGIGDWDSYYKMNNQGEEYLIFFIQGGVA